MSCPPHHYIVPSPDGNPTAMAKCKYCGAEKEVWISIPHEWEMSKTASWRREQEKKKAPGA